MTEMMPRQIQVIGSGIAAAATARLLSNSSIPVSHKPSSRSALAAILLSAQSQALLRDIFDDVSFLSPTHKIERRTVLWGESAQAVTLPHHGLVISEDLLLKSLWQRTPLRKEIPAVQASVEQAVFSIITTNAGSDSLEKHCFGQRTATISQAFLRDGVDQHACIIESLPSGWLFLLPLSAQRAALISVSICASLQDQLAHSRLVQNQIDAIVPSTEASIFPCAPQLSIPLTTERSLLCGSAALSFDPVCGEGTGNALREAFLVAAVVNAIACNEPIEKLAAHYSTRLLAGFLRHLQQCRGFYATGGTQEFWRSELALLDAGIIEVTKRLSKMPAPSYRFQDLHLESLD